MDTFAIVLNEPNGNAWKRVKEHWDVRFIVSETLAFVADSGPVQLSSSVAEIVGMISDDQILGVVLQVGEYNGFNNKAIWEWLGKTA